MGRQNISVTTDCVIFFRNGNKPKVLLVRRAKDPFKDRWALPGGFLEEEEPLEVGAKRELREETGLNIEKLEQLHTFGTPGRDPRGRTISITYWGVVDREEEVTGNDDAAEASWFELNELPDLAFDHSEIIQLAQKKYFLEHP